tara:strand:- start:604 stop:771 length:168 start_codon:yes stop_codon:yes gene_type:complete
MEASAEMKQLLEQLKREDAELSLGATFASAVFEIVSEVQQLEKSRLEMVSYIYVK